MKNVRKYLTSSEVEQLLAQAQVSRHSARDCCLIYICYVHGFRASELCKLTLQDLDLSARIINIRRLKNGLATIHPLTDREIKLINNWLDEREKIKGRESEWLFLSQKGNVISRQQFHSLLRNYGKLAGLTISPHPHMLRHACGYKLADLGADTRLIQDYLGHRNIRHTVLYTASNAGRFKGVWQN
ncbi:tyrosine-type recombinase/integrase [Salmonella enterica]|uniref:tyrosine-type DNA invertase n=1 Tax=Salmonella enterica TaxID=28901 RepID=UPI0009AEB1DD|nr:tyrosine-type DNA invertase [Salmonella enterica]EIS1622203.1 tyrosine-type recombinase/integrase [Salmonella enterica subsp. enterica serovar Sandiego]EIT4520863.1 tyrosine-type recombinase/integrase [Salmonella enterica subsp. enterica serovar Sandiego]ELJ4094520.1 tyrosine-type recombinase/integrase [Salmonella enterica]QVB77138.1 tyrosine-type recombinase/integrase [Salmonella enterica subsp. enterica serovar Rubislaw]